jgi:hypothetical protein
MGFGPEMRLPPMAHPPRGRTNHIGGGAGWTCDVDVIR